MSNDIIISFCVPSYNRADVTKKTVDSIIQYKGNDIEVYVCDNCSTDNTESLINSIGDKRVRVIINQTNIGAMGNYIESLRHAKGSFVFVVLSRDSIRHEAIPGLVSYLKENPNIAAMYCGEDKNKKKHKILKKGEEALINIGYHGLHQTGYIFNNHYLQKHISDISSEEAYSRYGYLPHDFIAARLALDGDCVLYNDLVRNRVDEKYMRNNKSACQEPGHNLWFFPEEKTKQFIKYATDLDSIATNDKIYSRVFKGIFWRQLVGATVIYKESRANESYCAHYNIPTYHVSRKDMLVAYKGMKSACNSVIEKANYTLDIKTRLFIASSGLLILLKIMKDYCVKLKRRITNR